MRNNSSHKPLAGNIKIRDNAKAAIAKYIDTVNIYSKYEPQITLYILDFTDELENADSLCGRENIFSELVRFESSCSCGYLRLTADSGLGKTALAAAVAKRLHAAAFFANYNVGLTHADKCLNHLSCQIIDKFQLPYSDLPPRAGDDSKFFETVLKEASRKAGKPLWFVVDGFDLADSVPGQNNFLLPARLPKGVYGFLTQRPGTYQLTTEWNTTVRDQELLPNSAMQRADIAMFLSREIKRPDIAKMVIALRLGEDSLLTRLQEDSEGSFMYLRYVLADLAAGELPFTLSDKGRFPRGLNRYYEAIWSRMEEIAQGDAEWKSLYRAVIGLLAVAREAVTASWLANLSASTAITVNEQVLSKWLRFLKLERRDAGDHWRILHRSFATFLSKEIDLKKSHLLVATHYIQTANWATDNRYASKHLSKHLHLAGSVADLCSLVGNRAWYKSQITLDNTGAAYEADLFQATSLSSALDRAEVTLGKAPWLAQEIICAYLSATMKGFWRNINPNFLPSVVKAGVLDEHQALTLALRNLELNGSSPSLVKLASLISETEAVAAIRMIRDPETKSNALVALAARCSGGQKQTLISEALRSAREMEDGVSKVVALRAVAVELTKSDQAEIRQETINLAVSLIDPEKKVSALEELAAWNCPELLDSAVSTALSLDDSQSKVEYLAHLIPSLTANRRPDIMFRAKTIALGLKDQIEKSSALTALVGAVISCAEVDDIFHAALEAAQSISNPSVKVTQLLNLSDTLLNRPEREPTLKAAEKAIEELIDNPNRYALALCGVVARDSQEPARLGDAVKLLERAMPLTDCVEALISLAREIFDDAKVPVLASAEQLARRMSDPVAMARSLLKIGVMLPDDRMRPLVQEAARIPGGLLRVDQLENDNVELVELVGALSAHLSGSERQDVVQKALSIAFMLEDPVAKPYDQGRALASLLPALDLPQRGKVCDKILTIARSLKEKDEQADLLTKVVDHVPDKDRPSVLEEALVAARNSPSVFQFTGKIDSETGRISIDRVPEIRGKTALALLEVALKGNEETRARLIYEAFDSIFGIEGRRQAEILVRLAPHLPGVLIWRIVENYRFLVNDPVRNAFRSALRDRFDRSPSGEKLTTYRAESHQASAMPAKEAVGEEDEVAESDGSEEDQGHFEIRSFGPVFRLTPTFSRSGIDITFDPPAPTPEKQQDWELKILPNLAAVLPAEHLESIYADACELTSEKTWHRAMAAVFDRLARLESAEVALEEARKIWSSDLPSVVVGALAARFVGRDRRLLAENGTVSAEKLADSIDRIIGLGSLVPCLEGQLLDEVLRKLGAEIEREMDVEEFSAALPYLQKLPRSYVLSFLQTVLSSTPDRQMLLSRLRDMVSEIELLGVPEAVQTISAGLLDASGWWS